MRIREVDDDGEEDRGEGWWMMCRGVGRAIGQEWDAYIRQPRTEEQAVREGGWDQVPGLEQNGVLG